MKKNILLFLLSFIISNINAQSASRIIATQGPLTPKRVQNIVWVQTDTVLGATYRFTVASLDSLILNQANIKNLSDSLLNKYTKSQSDSRYAQKNGTSSQYSKADGTFGTILTNLNSFTNGPGYIDQSGARTSISLTTTGASGVSTYNSSTGVLNVPQYTFSQAQSDWNASSGTSFIQNKPTIPSNTNQLTNGAGFITGVTVGAPSTGNSITSGTAFQPRSGGPCQINVSSSIGSGLAAVTGTIIIATSPTQNGTYTTVTTDGVILSLLNSSLDRSSATIPVPTGYWIKVTYSVTGIGASLTGTYTKWDL